MRIIIADNEFFFTENVARYLQNELKVEVDCVKTAAEAEKSIEKMKYDLVISDLDLSDSSDGLWLLDLAMKNPGQEIIITSAREIPKILKENKNIRLRAYLEKPFDLTELKKKIMQFISEQKV